MFNPFNATSQIVTSQKRIAVPRIQQRTQKLNKIIYLSRDEIRTLLMQDSIESSYGYPFRFGKNFEVDVDFIKEANSIQKGDTTYFTYEIKSPLAYSINLIFDIFELNNNSLLYIYNNEGNFIYGPVSSKNNPPNGVFWTDLIKGDHIVIELIELYSSSSQKNQLHISSVIHGYKNTFVATLFGDAWPYPCNIDIACPEGDNWRVEGNAVAMLLVNEANRFCSGSLINNTSVDFKGYLLTAFHCLDWDYNCSLSTNEENAVNNWLFRLQYESPTCNGIEGTEHITMNGANFRAA